MLVTFAATTYEINAGIVTIRRDTLCPGWWLQHHPDGDWYLVSRWRAWRLRHGGMVEGMRLVRIEDER